MLAQVWCVGWLGRVRDGVGGWNSQKIKGVPYGNASKKVFQFKAKLMAGCKCTLNWQVFNGKYNSPNVLYVLKNKKIFVLFSLDIKLQ